MGNKINNKNKNSIKSSTDLIETWEILRLPNSMIDFSYDNKFKK